MSNLLVTIRRYLSNSFGKKKIASTHDPILDEMKRAKIRAELSIEMLEQRRKYPIGSMVSVASRIENRRNANGRSDSNNNSHINLQR
jgi:hypothetical protein